MVETEENRIAHAAACGAEEISRFVHDQSPRVIRALLGNGLLTEDDAVIIANRKNLPADILETISKDKRWADSYPVRLALARNPHTPLRVSLSVVRFLRLFDLEEITRSHFIPLVFRHKVEAMIVERIPTMPLGNKKTLAKKAAGNILLKLLQDRDAEVIQLCLNNPNMVEGHLFKIINKEDTSVETILMIARHPNWSSRGLIRFSLARNSHMPLSLSVPFIRTMKLTDLRELFADPFLPASVKPFVYRQLLARGKDPEQKEGEEIYEISEEELDELDAEVTKQEIIESDDENVSENKDKDDPASDRS